MGTQKWTVGGNSVHDELECTYTLNPRIAEELILECRALLCEVNGVWLSVKQARTGWIARTCLPLDPLSVIWNLPGSQGYFIFGIKPRVGMEHTFWLIILLCPRAELILLQVSIGDLWSRNMILVLKSTLLVRQYC